MSGTLADNIRIPLLGAQRAVENARHHSDAAELLAKARMFGMAIAHLVLAVEEGGKAHVLLDEAQRRFVDPSIATDWAEFKRWLSKHDFKQRVAEVHSWSWPHSTFMHELAQAGLLEPGASLVTAQIEALAKAHQDILPPGWPGNKLKEAGFYVDLEARTPPLWQSPGDVTEVNWVVERQRVRAYIAAEERRVEFLTTVLIGDVGKLLGATARSS